MPEFVQRLTGSGGQLNSRIIQHSWSRTDMATREKIISEIHCLTDMEGRPVGQNTFARHTGIRAHEWMRIWPRWSDAIKEAGYEPNEKTGKLDTEMLFERLAEVARHYGKIPTRAEIGIYRQKKIASSWAA